MKDCKLCNVMFGYMLLCAFQCALILVVTPSMCGQVTSYVVSGNACGKVS